MAYLTLPLGCIISALLTGLKILLKRFYVFRICIIFFLLCTDPIGRKYSMLGSNIPFAIGWIMLYNASDITYIYIGLGFLGLVSSQNLIFFLKYWSIFMEFKAYGVAESGVITYVGEIRWVYLYSTFNIHNVTYVGEIRLIYWIHKLNICLRQGLFPRGVEFLRSNVRKSAIAEYWEIREN